MAKNYLRYDEMCLDYLKVTEYLMERDISFVRLMSHGFSEPQLVVSGEVFVGLRRIKLGVENRLIN